MFEVSSEVRAELRLRLMLLQEAARNKESVSRTLSECVGLHATDILQRIAQVDAIAKEQIDWILDLFDNENRSRFVPFEGNSAAQNSSLT